MSPYTPPARPSIRVIRSSPYKGGTKEWSQRFFFDGPNFTLAEFEVAADQLRDWIKTCTLAESNIVQYVAYDIGSDVPVHTRTVTTAGTYTSTANPTMPLEVCILTRLTTTQRTSKNHPIYGFKYWHNVQNNADSDHEKARTGLRSGINDVVTALLAGFSDGTQHRDWCDARGAVFQDFSTATELTHRDFPN